MSWYRAYVEDRPEERFRIKIYCRDTRFDGRIESEDYMCDSIEELDETIKEIREDTQRFVDSIFGGRDIFELDDWMVYEYDGDRIYSITENERYNYLGQVKE